MILAKTPREKEIDETIAAIRKGTRELLKSKKKARAFLIKYGYITEDGKLTKRYGG